MVDSALLVGRSVETADPARRILMYSRIRGPAALARALAMVVMLAVSGRLSAQPSGTPAPPPASATMRVLLSHETTSTDPADRGCPGALAAALYRPVLRLKPGSFLVDTDASAARLEASDDGRTLTLRLREGLKFADGSPIEAGDVAATIERMHRADHPDRPRAHAIDPALLASIEKVSVKGPRQVEVLLRTTDATIVTVLASERAGIVKASRPDARPVASGAYKLDEGGSGHRLVPNPHAGAPPPMAVTFGGAPPGPPRLFWIAAGLGHVAWGVPPELGEALARRPGFGVAASTAPGALVMAMNMTREPTRVGRVRSAFVLAISRKRLLPHVFSGSARAAGGYFDPYHVAPGVPGTTPSPAGRDADVLAARRLLTPGELDGSIAVNLWVVDDGHGGVTRPHALAEALRVSLRELKVGAVTAIVKAADLARRLNREVPQVLVMAIEEPLADPLFRLRAVWDPGHPIARVMGWNNTEAPALCARGAAALGRTRDYILSEVDNLLVTDVPIITLAVPQTVTAYRDPVKRVGFTSSGEIDLAATGP